MSIKQDLFQAVKIIVNAENKKLKFTKTIEANVYDNSESASGRYKVKYQDSIFYAYSNDVNLQYNINDIVLVLIPEGDFSQQKTIIGKKGSAANEGDYASTQDILQKIDLIGPDWSSDNLAGYHEQISEPIGLIAGGTIEKITIFNGFTNIQDNTAKLFTNYFKKCHAFLIKADFRTRFPSDKIQEYYGGNYGVRLTFTQDGIEYIYILDLSNMTGDPYSYSVNSPQYIVYQYDNEALENAILSKIEIFQEGFNVIPQEEADIFISNLQLSFVEEIDTLDSGYSVNVRMPQGNMITSRDISLIPQLKLNGVETTFSSAMWFIRDISVNVASKNYNSYAGLGWRQIKEGLNGNNLILNSLSGIGKKIYSETELKLVVTKDKNTFSKIVEVYPLTSSYNFTMGVAYNNDSVTLSIEPKGDLQSDYSYAWGKIDSSGISYALDSTTSSYNFNINEIYLNNTFYCSIYNRDKELLSTVKTTISTELTADNVTIVFIGNHFYSYDANGDIDINTANAEHELGFELYSISGEKIEVASCEWIFPEESLSMIAPIGSDLTLSSIKYKIQPKYNVNRLNNTVILKVKTFNDQVYEFRKEIVCLKTGNSGTNGTKYVIALTYSDTAHSYVQKGNTNQTAIVNLNVYEDGVIVSPSEYNYSWSIEGKDKDIKLIEILNSDATKCNVVFNSVNNDITDENVLNSLSLIKVSVSIGGYKINAFKAIPIVLSGTYDNSIDWIDFVEYNPSGEQPSYNKNAFIPKNWRASFNEIETDENPIYFRIDRIRVFDTENIGTSKKRDEFNYESNYSLIPVDRYSNSGKSANVILSKDSNKVLWCVLFWINTYGNESINDWDGVSVNIDEKNGYILSPVVGAGEKNSSSNKFTGVLMGTVGYYEGNSLKKSTGLFGYDEGVQTFNIDSETGNIRLGAPTSGGIDINAEKSVISTYEFKEAKIETDTNGFHTLKNGKGTRLDLGSGNIYTPQFVIENGNAYFSGNLSGANGSFSGKIEASSGEIGAWSITESGDLQATVAGGSIWLSASTGSIHGSKTDATSNSWSITPEGITTSYLNASGGYIGGWSIEDGNLISGSAGLYPNGGFNFGPFGAYGTDGGTINSSSNEIRFLGSSDGQVGMDIQGYVWAGWNGQYGSNSKYGAYLSVSDGYGYVRADKYEVWDEIQNKYVPLNGSMIDTDSQRLQYVNVWYGQNSNSQPEFGYYDKDNHYTPMVQNPVFDDGSWTGIYLTTTGSGSNFTINTMRPYNSQFNYGICINDSARSDVTDENFKSALKTYLGSIDSGGKLATNGKGTWWYSSVSSEPSGFSVLTNSAKDQTAATYLGVANGVVQLWNIGLKNGLVTQNNTANPDYTSTLAGIIAGYL